MKIAAMCQPDAISPPVIAVSGAWASRWNGCGSNSRANAMMSSAVTGQVGCGITSPTAKSSNVRMAAGTNPDSNGTAMAPR